MLTDKRHEFGAQSFSFTKTTMSVVLDIGAANETTKLNEVLDSHQHLMLLLRHEVILTDGLKYVRQNSRYKVTSKTMTWIQVISLIILLKVNCVVLELWKESQVRYLLNYGSWYIIATYRLAATLSLVIDAKTSWKMNSFELMGNMETDMCQQIVSASP